MLSKKKSAVALNILEAVTEALPIPIFYQNTKGIYLGCNTAFVRIAKKPKEKIIGFAIRDLWPAAIAQAELLIDEQLIKRGGWKSFVSQRAWINGLVKPVVVYKAVWRDQSGKILGLAGVITLTGQAAISPVGQKNIEKKLEQSLAEQKKLNQLMFGRELKMVELKEKIKKLESGAGVAALRRVKTWVERFQEGIELEEDFIKDLSGGYLDEVANSSFSAAKKKKMKQLIQILIDESIEHKQEFQQLQKYEN